MYAFEQLSGRLRRRLRQGALHERNERSGLARGEDAGDRLADGWLLVLGQGRDDEAASAQIDHPPHQPLGVCPAARIKMTAALSLIFAVCTLVYSSRTGSLSLTTALVLAVPVFAAGCLPFLFTRKPAASVTFMAAMTLVAMIVVMYLVAPNFADHQSSKRLLQLAAARGYSQTAIYGMQRSDRTPEFYAAGRVVYGLDGEPILYGGLNQAFAECRKRNEPLLTFVPVREVNQFSEMSSSAEVIGSNGRYAIVAVCTR